MRENLFEMGADFEDEWSSDNKDKSPQRTTHKKSSTEIKLPEKHQLHFAKEKRRGKVVTLVAPFCLEKSKLQSLLKTLKKKLGTGGTARDNTLEFQGDIPDKLRQELKILNYRFKK